MTYASASIFHAWCLNQSTQLDLAGGCNTVIPRDFVVWGVFDQLILDAAQA
jgi:hypothetical protein